ncbi:biotin transporter BioY [Paenibacillus kobensis]|uniref:biotin transporter BioY n=1 Tax=Paenibacillus kobensis TaxID=59841 RepID=UPI001FE6EF95|nr:biotin transporter BioY [Paenibacillus kobensis]
MRNGSIRNIVYTALFAALFIALSSVAFKLSFSTVPITLQMLAVMLAGAFLGPRLGFASIFIVLLLTATGLHLLHGEGGISYLTGATGGYLVGFLLSTITIGWLVGKLLDSRFSNNRIAMMVGLFLIFEIFGSLLCYVPAIPWLMHTVETYTFNKAMVKGCFTFLPGDAVKSVMATAITMSLLPVVKMTRPRKQHQSHSYQKQTGMSH